MDINHLIKDVINLNGYIDATQNVLNKTNIKVTINIATVLSLKKIRSLEIEYFNKYDDNGVACVVLERLLATPPSKVWGVLAKDLVNLLQYWLEAIRKHLINHSTEWWKFLKLILRFIKEIHVKDPSIPNMLVEFTSGCLFELATASAPDVFQRQEIMHCQNIVCAASGREVRFAMRTKFGEYFVKLASDMSLSGYLPYQYSCLECLLRWLLPRQERAVRAAAADRWFPRDLCPAAARTLFLTSSWMDFFQDARDFLNALNDGNGLVTSVICRHLSIGKTVLIDGTERQQFWVDFNTSVKCISVLLDPRVLQAFGLTGHRACETLVIEEGITETALLSRESLGLTISLMMHRGPNVRPTEVSMGDEREVTLVISSRADLWKLDKAMRTTFGEKYQLQLDPDTDVSQSPKRSYNKNKNGNHSEEDTRFSHPVEVKRHKYSGCVVKTCNAGLLNSSSTASTSSLIQLKDRLAALPRYQFDKEPVSVCALPALSNVTERTEIDDSSIHTATTSKFQLYGVCHNTFKKPTFQKATDIKSRSDGETVRQKCRGGRRLLSPVVSDDNSYSTNVLLVANVGSSNESVLNDTIERLSKSKDFQGDNIVDLLIQEAMQANTKSRDVSDSGINTDEKKSQEESEAIEDTPTDMKATKRVPFKKTCISTTDDESNTEAINETPGAVYTKNKKRSHINLKTTYEAEIQTFDVKTVDEFFSQHVSENNKGEILISPTLAKKINETSSETSENIDENLFNLNVDVNTDVEQVIFNDIAIIDCLNDMVDKVCNDFDKYTESFYKENVIEGTNETVDNVSDIKDKKGSKSKRLEDQKPNKNIKLKYKPAKKAKTRVTRNTKKLEQNSTKKMSTIVEQKEENTMREDINLATENEEVDVVNDQSPKKKVETPKTEQTETPMVRKKRKLYSPKDDEIEEELQQFTSDDVLLSVLKTRQNHTPKTYATCYKELEKERKKYTRLTRSRKSKRKEIEMSSPRTLKMNTMFDNLKHTVEGNEKITLVDTNNDVYNFTSDSDDEDFKKKKIEIKTRLGSAKIKKSRNTRVVKESESSYEEAKNAKTVKRKKVTKRTTKRKSCNIASTVDLVQKSLIDEKMRKAVREELNSSILIEPPTNLVPEEIEPALKEQPQMEHIQESEFIDTLILNKNSKTSPIHKYDSESNDTLASYKNVRKTRLDQKHDSASNDTFTSKKRVNKKIITIKKEKGNAKKKTVIIPDNDDGTSSPLPRLIVEETRPKCKDDINDSLTTNILQKFKRIYQEGPDAVNDSTNTQNMLSDVERFNYSTHNCINISDDVCSADGNKENDNVNAEMRKKHKSRKAIQPKATKHNYKKEIETDLDNTKDIQKMPAVNDMQSEKSIATDGITAHGDLDEAPPTAEAIDFQPRELQDLSQSLRDYFTKLTREIHDSTKEHESSKSMEGEVSKKHSEADRTSAISPIVSIKRLSFENISKWMPSRRTSDSSPQTSPQKAKLTKRVNETPSVGRLAKINTAETTPKSSQTLSPDAVKLKSPSVAIARISLEEFNKWLPMPKCFDVPSLKEQSGDLKLIYKTRSKSKHNNEAQKGLTNLKESVKTKSTKIDKTKRVQTDTYESDDTTLTCIQTRSKRICKDKGDRQPNHSEASNDTDLKNKSKSREMSIPSEASVKKNKSFISPVRSFKDAIHFEAKSSDDELKTRSKPAKDTNTKSIKNIESPKSMPKLRKRKSNSPILSGSRCNVSKRMIDESDIDEDRFDEPKRRMDESEKRVKAPTKSFDSKKVDIFKDATLTSSGPSTSSVNDWFRKIDTTSHKDNASMSLRETIQNVMEKLDTTLVEINQNTSKKFVNLFVEAQKDLDKLSEQIAKSQAMIEDFKVTFKKQAFELIRADCRQTRDMVLLLKEDVKAAIDHVDRERTDSP